MKRFYKNVILIIFLLMSIVGCNRYEWIPTSGGGITWARLAEVKRNGVILEDTLTSFNIKKNDTIEFTVEFELDYVYDDVKLDSIRGYIETDLRFEEVSQSKMDSLDTQAEDFTFSEEINSEPGNQKIYRTFRFINRVARPNIYKVNSPMATKINLLVQIKTYASPDEGFEKYPDTNLEEYHQESVILGLQLNNQYKVSTFRLYNNYVGKDPEDSTGVGFDVNEREYCHDLTSLYCYYDQDLDCGASCDRTLINLTYDTLYNTSNKEFIPAFGVDHSIRSKVKSGFTSAPIIFAEDNEGELIKFFDWERGHGLDRKYGATSTEVLEILEPEIGREYRLSFSNSSGITKAYIRIKDIVEDGLNSYVEFDLAINKSQLPQPETL
jgi:hypothetical protein